MKRNAYNPAPALRRFSVHGGFIPPVPAMSQTVQNQQGWTGTACPAYFPLVKKVRGKPGKSVS
jgi:hypothetical protein